MSTGIICQIHPVRRVVSYMMGEHYHLVTHHHFRGARRTLSVQVAFSLKLSHYVLVETEGSDDPQRMKVSAWISMLGEKETIEGTT